MGQTQKGIKYPSDPTEEADLLKDLKDMADSIDVVLVTLDGHAVGTLELSLNSSTYEIELKVKDLNATLLATETLDIGLSEMVVDGVFNSNAKKIVLTQKDNSTIEIDISEIIDNLANKLDRSLKGAANGVAELDANGRVPTSQLPSFVDDVIEGYYYNSKFYKESTHTTEIDGEAGKIYLDLSTEKVYRWSGSVYVVISETIAIGETSSTAFRGDHGKIAYDHAMDPNKVSSAKTKKLYKVGVTAEGHISGVEEVPITETIDENSTDSQLPTAGAVYRALSNLAENIDNDIIDLDTRIDLIEGRVDISTLTWAEIQAIVKAGKARKYFNIGDQLITTWTDTETDTEYEVPLDVVSFEDVIVLDENQQEKTVPGMILQWHYCSPFNMVFDSREAFYVAPEAMAAGTYYFTFGTSPGKDAAGTSFQFTLTQAIPAGTQLYFESNPHDYFMEGKNVLVYTVPGSDTVSETAVMTAGTNGTFLGEITGSIKYSTSGVNNINRIIYGYNRYNQSVIRQYLNSNQNDWWSPQNPFDRLASNRDKHGFLTGVESDLLAVISPVKVSTLLNTTTDTEIGTIEHNFDKFFLPSLEQCYCVPFAQGEGSYWEYWKQKSGTQNPNSRGSTNANLITYAVNAHTSAQVVRLRSASRSTTSYAYYIHVSGNVSNYSAYNAYRFAPACVIC